MLLEANRNSYEIMNQPTKNPKKCQNGLNWTLLQTMEINLKNPKT